MNSNRASNALWFLAGLSAGTALGLLAAPASGADTRRYLYARRELARDYMLRGRELYDRGRELADEAATLYEDGRHLVEAATADPEGLEGRTAW